MRLRFWRKDEPVIEDIPDAPPPPWYDGMTIDDLDNALLFLKTEYENDKEQLAERRRFLVNEERQAALEAQAGLPNAVTHPRAKES